MTAEFLSYTTGPRDRWDLLADRFYGDPGRFEPIMRANPDLGHSTFLPEGVAIRIPILEETSDPALGLPPWRL